MELLPIIVSHIPMQRAAAWREWLSNIHQNLTNFLSFPTLCHPMCESPNVIGSLRHIHHPHITHHTHPRCQNISTLIRCPKTKHYSYIYSKYCDRSCGHALCCWCSYWCAAAWATISSQIIYIYRVCSLARRSAHHSSRSLEQCTAINADAYMYGWQGVNVFSPLKPVEASVISFGWVMIRFVWRRVCTQQCCYAICRRDLCENESIQCKLII